MWGRVADDGPSAGLWAVEWLELCVAEPQLTGERTLDQAARVSAQALAYRRSHAQHVHTRTQEEAAERRQREAHRFGCVRAAECL